MMQPDLTRRQLLATAGSLSLPVEFRVVAPTTRSFWVLKLLHPASLVVHPLGTARLHCASDQGSWIVEGREVLSITRSSSPVSITGPGNGAVGCLLEIPNVIRRSYFGTFNIFGDAGMMIPIVTMDCEIAAGSVLGAELPADESPTVALAAQAVVSRSVVCAATTPRHSFADFCDTTHCQFLRSPAPAEGKVASAIRSTGGLVLFDRGRILPALYSAACGGVTESGLDRGYQYVSSSCEICRNSRTLRRGHGWGLCQEGALGFARLGWTWRDILSKYYPNAVVGLKG